MIPLPWHYIGLALAVAGALWFAFNTGRDNTRAELQPQLDAALWSISQLSDALAYQNTAIAKQGQQQKAVEKASAKAVRVGAERRGALDAAAARVEAVRPSEACRAVPGDVARLWKQF